MFQAFYLDFKQLYAIFRIFPEDFPVADSVLVHVSRMSFLSERFLRFVLIVWSLYIRVSITSIVFLMGTLMSNDSTSKDTYLYSFTNKLNGIS